MLGIALALAASVCWGSGDFLGGFSTRRASLWAVIIGSQAVGLAGAALVTLGTGHGWPGLHAVWPVLLGGLASVVAISCFYKALAIGTMSIVAPISATNALIPFAVGLAAGERPAVAQLAGVVAGRRGRDPRGHRAGARAARRSAPRRSPASRRSSRPAPRRSSRSGRAAGHRPAGGRAASGSPASRPGRRDQRRAIALALTAAVCMGLVLSATTPPPATTRCGPCSAAALLRRPVHGPLPGAATARQGGALGGAVHRRRRHPRHRRERPVRAGDHARAT